MATSTTSLYTVPGTVTVLSNNLTTLYNATGGNVVTANVPDRNFTTLYTQQSDTKPTVPYGNANVEAFLNVGSDAGGNQVQNIVMFGNVTSAGGASFAGNVIVANLSVSGETSLGPPGNVHITGGSLNYVLQTDGAGNLSWAAQSGAPTVNAVEYIHFDVVANANNQSFTNANLSAYSSNVNMNVMKNGVNIEPTLYVKTGGTTIQINIPLNTGDSIDVLAAASGGAGSGGSPGGNLTDVQYNGGAVLSGNSSFTFDQANSLLTVGNVSTGNINASNITISAKSNLGPVGNVIITGGSNGQYLRTDGAGNLSWVSGTSTTASALNANIANVIIFGGSNGQSLTTDGNGVLSWTSITSANSNYANFAGEAFSVSASNIVGVVNLANYATVANSIAGANVSGAVASANFATLSTYATTANSVAGANVTGTVANANYSVIAGLANSVAVANVSGIGNIAVLNLTGSNSDVLYGNGIFAPAAGGNSANANYANFAGNLINGTSNVNTNGSGGNISISVGAIANVATFANNSINLNYPINTPNNIIIGNSAGNRTASQVGLIAIGSNAGVGTQGTVIPSITIGVEAGNTVAGNGGIAIGYQAGRSLSDNSIAMGYNAGGGGTGQNSVVVGTYASFFGAGTNLVAIGANAGKAGTSNTVSVGISAGRQQAFFATAIGPWAAGSASVSQGNGAVALGYYAGYEVQGSNSIAIGANAGYLNQGNNSIILNATGSNLNQTTANTFTVKPVRNIITSNAIFYNNSTGEISYDTLANNTSNVGANNITANNVSINSSGFVKLASYTKVALTAITGAVGWIASVTNSTPGGMLAYWDTTNSRWSYVHDNSAV